MATKKRYYWDSSIFVSLVTGEADRIAALQGILDDARRGEIEIVTSTFTLAEVRRHKGEPTLTHEQYKLVSAYFEHEFITLVALDREIGNRAAVLGEKFGLKPADAVQLASALRARAHVFHAWDGHFSGEKLRADPPLPIEEPGARPRQLVLDEGPKVLT
jgi:predicted nucleic acid-binding protein